MLVGDYNDNDENERFEELSLLDGAYDATISGEVPNVDDEKTVWEQIFDSE